MSMITELIKKLREVAKKYYDNNGSSEYEVFKYLHEAADTIEELSAKLHAANMERSSQYYHGGWIPCEDRLPEVNEDVLLTMCDNSSLCGFNENFIKVRCGRYQPKNDRRDWLVGEVRYYFENIIAWRPLPEPYQANEKEVEDADSN